MADRLSQYPMNFNNNMLQQQQLQQQQSSQQHQDSHSNLPPGALDQAMIWQMQMQQQQFRPHGAVEMNSPTPAQVRIPLLFSPSFRSQLPSSWEPALTQTVSFTLFFRLVSLFIPLYFFL